MTEALLYDLQHVPGCVKIRICLQLKGIAFRRAPVSWRTRRSLAGTRATGLPILIDAAQRLVGPGAIIDHLEAAGVGPRLLPDDPGARAYCRLLDQWADDVLGRLVADVVWCDPVRAERVALATASELVPALAVRPVAAWLMRRGRRRHGDAGRRDAPAELAAALALLESLLEARPHLLGGAVSLADVAVYVQLARLGAIDLERLPRLAAWRDRMESRTAVLTAVDP